MLIWESCCFLYFKWKFIDFSFLFIVQKSLFSHEKIFYVFLLGEKATVLGWFSEKLNGRFRRGIELIAFGNIKSLFKKFSVKLRFESRFVTSTFVSLGCFHFVILFSFLLFFKIFHWTALEFPDRKHTRQNIEVMSVCWMRISKWWVIHK